MRRFWVKCDSEGYVTARKAVPESYVPSGEGWVEVTRETHDALSAQRPDQSAWLSNGANVAMGPSRRPLPVQQARIAERLDLAADEAVCLAMRPREILRLLVAHSIALGVISDSKAEAQQKTEAVDKERALREQLSGAFELLSAVCARTAEIKQSIAGAKSASELPEIGIERFDDLRSER